MIFGGRTQITGVLTLESDMHIGVSDTKSIDSKPEVSLIARGVGDVPIIPASSLKGVLRAALSISDANAIFGDGSEHRQGKGHAAMLWLDHARLETNANGLEGLSKETPINGVFEATHVALDPKTGAAEEHKLFTREMVAKGATFSFRANWFGNDLGELAQTFAVLRDGIQLGSGASKGQGRASVCPTTLCLKVFSPEHGKLEEQELDASDFCVLIDAIGVATGSAKTIKLTLEGEGPFLSVRDTAGHNSGNIMQPMVRDGKPLLWPHSIAGALRARARWLAALRDGDHNDTPSKSRKRDEMGDDNLSPVERLFGITGRKSNLTVKSVNCTAPGSRVVLQNNSIDRFTGATIDTALYGKNAFWQPCFEIELEVTGEHDLLQILLDDLDVNGLELGHGSSTGFGWFGVEVAQ